MERKIDRLDKYMSVKGLNDNRITIEAGITNGVIGKSRKEGRDLSAPAMEQILKTYPDLSSLWLMTGEGEMLNDLGIISKLETKKDKIAALNELITDIQKNGKISKMRFIPLMNIDAVGGNTNGVCDTPEYIEEMIPARGVRDSSICIPVSGDSMMPIFNPGDLVIIDEIIEWNLFLEMGQYYVLVLKDGRRLIKKLTYSEEDRKQKFLLVSENTSYPPAELPKMLIQRIFIVTQKYQKLTL